jgi:transcription termination factor Rho
MTKSELESKSLADLHALAAEAGVPKYRMLSRGELVERLSDGGSGSGGSRGARGGSQRESGQRERSSRPRRERRPRERRPAREQEADEAPAPEPTPPASAPAAADEPAPRRRRRRRRFGRRGGKEVTLQGLLLPPEAGRQAVLCAESRAACTALLRGLAAELSGSKGPDPVALLIDPSPEELAEWRRDAPKAEIVAAGQARHATDALAQAQARAGAGDDVILLVDSLTRLAEAYGDAEQAKDFFDAGRAPGGAGGGSLTVVAALER